MLDPSSIKALFFDVFGTVVDWRTSIARDAEAVLRPNGYVLDWLAFADAWRDEYEAAGLPARRGSIRLRACRMRDGRGAFRRSGRRCEDRSQDRARRAPERARAGQRRAQADRAGRYGGVQFYRARRQARRVALSAR